MKAKQTKELKASNIKPLSREHQRKVMGGVEMAEVAVTLVGIAIADAGTVKPHGKK